MEMVQSATSYYRRLTMTATLKCDRNIGVGLDAVQCTRVVQVKCLYNLTAYYFVAVDAQNILKRHFGNGTLEMVNPKYRIIYENTPAILTRDPIYRCENSTKNKMKCGKQFDLDEWNQSHC